MRVAAAVTLWLLLVFGPARSSTLEIGHAAPDFTLSDQYGKTFHLAEQRGSVVVLLYADRAGAKYHAAVMAAIDDGVRTGRFPKPTVRSRQSSAVPPASCAAGSGPRCAGKTPAEPGRLRSCSTGRTCFSPPTRSRRTPTMS